MRVISQDGYTDIPYEKFIFYKTACNNIIAAKDFGADPDVLFSGEIAKYSTREKALKAMELLREKYGKLKVMKVIANGTAEYMEKSLSTDEMIEQYNAYCDMNTFQFPQDDEVEV
jgi:hypothetical protein